MQALQGTRESEASSVDDTDEMLMRRVSRGDDGAFVVIAKRHTPMLFAIAWRMLGDRAEAEDVVQDTLTKAWVNSEGWTATGGGLGAWLRRIATNLCFDRRRKRAFVSDEAIADRCDDAPAADALIDEENRRQRVAAAMQVLPDRQRAALVLTYYEGLSNAEAAATLDIGIKALESLLVRARQGLSRELIAAGLLQEGSAA